MSMFEGRCSYCVNSKSPKSGWVMTGLQYASVTSIHQGMVGEIPTTLTKDGFVPWSEKDVGMKPELTRCARVA